MIKKYVLPISMFFFGILFYGFNRQWLVIAIPGLTRADYVPGKIATEKKIITLYYWMYDKWHHETTELLWPAEPSEALLYVARALLALLYEQKILTKRVGVQSVVEAKNNCMLISFDRNPFHKQSSTHDKLFIIESMLKTIHATKLKVQSVMFLVHHQPLNDYHLDFTNPWPIAGFIER